MRRDQLLELMERRRLGAVLLRRPENFSWYTGGGNSRVDYMAAEGVADVVITRTADYVLTSTIEASRMRDEQAPGTDVVEYPWHEGPSAARRELVGAVELGSDGECAPRPRGLRAHAVEDLVAGGLAA